MATRIVLYPRLNKAGGYALIPVEYSRNGSPIADKRATAFSRFRAGGKRFCNPAGSNVLEADAQRKVLEARLATGEVIPATAPTNTIAATDRKVISTEAAAYIERTRKRKKPKTYKGYKDAVELFISTCKKKYLDDLPATT